MTVTHCVTDSGVLDKAVAVVDSGKVSPTTAVDAGNVSSTTPVVVNSWQANGGIPTETAYDAAASRRSAWPSCPPSEEPFQDYVPLDDRSYNKPNLT